MRHLRAHAWLLAGQLLVIAMGILIAALLPPWLGIPVALAVGFGIGLTVAELWRRSLGLGPTPIHRVLRWGYSTIGRDAVGLVRRHVRWR